jgi:hypothetical protein
MAHVYVLHYSAGDVDHIEVFEDLASAKESGEKILTEEFPGVDHEWHWHRDGYVWSIGGDGEGILVKLERCRIRPSRKKGK